MEEVARTEGERMNLDNASVCKYCWKTVSKDKMINHLEKRCPKYPYSGKTLCPTCKTWIQNKKFEEHKRKHK